MYRILEIQYPDRYRPKLPVDQNELAMNIKQTRKLLGAGAELQSASAATASNRLASNPPPARERAPKPLIIKEVRAPPVPRVNDQKTKQLALLSPSSVTAKSVQNLHPKKKSSIETSMTNINITKGSGSIFDRKQTQPPLTTKETIKSTKDFQKEMEERRNLAEVHKRIRLEKQNTGRVMSVSEAQQ